MLLFLLVFVWSLLPCKGIDEFPTDEENLAAYLRILGKD